MAGFRAVYGEPGLYATNDSISEDPPGSGLYTTGMLVEDPPGSGLYAFEALSATQPIVTAAPTGTPSPFVDVLVDVIPDGVSRVTAWRVVGGRRFKARGLVDVLAAGGVTVRDYEAPFLVPSNYQVEYFDAAGSTTGYSDTATTTLTGLAPNEAIFHNPLDPASAVRVTLVQGAAASINRSTEGAVAQMPGRSVGLTFPGTRSGVQGVVLDCYTATREDGERFDALFGGYDSDALSIVCVRSRPETWLPPTLFAFVGKPGLQPIGNDGEAVRWALSGDETTPPTPAVITPLLTYEDFTAFYSSYEVFGSSYPDYLTASRDYSVKGS